MRKKRKFRKVAKSKGVPKKYLSGAKNKSSRAADIKRACQLMLKQSARLE